MRRSQFCIAAAACALAGIATADATRVAIDYPLQSDGCVLSGDISENRGIAPGSGIGIMYRFGQVVATKHGEWRCVKAVARQADASAGGVWVETTKH